MKVLRYSFALLALVALVAVALSGSACTFAKKVIAKDKYNQAILAQNRGQTKEAAQLLKEATDLVPDSAVAWLNYGVILRKQFQTVVGADRDAKFKQTLDAFTKALELSNNNCALKDSAIGYIATIYSDIDDKDKHREWLLKRAEDKCADKTTKAITYYSIAHDYWECAYAQSTRYADKKQNADPFHYRNFYFEPDKQKFEDCLNKGMQYIEMTLQVNPEYAEAIAYQSLLYREKQKATKNDAERKKFGEQAEAIGKRAIELTKQQKDKPPQG